jgi:hypothetical protein
MSTFEEYNQAERVNTALVTAVTILFLRSLVVGPISPTAWLQAMAELYRIILQARYASGRNARRFYDSERAKYVETTGVEPVDLDALVPDSVPERPRVTDTREPERFDIDLAGYTPAKFIERMEPVRREFEKPNTPETVVQKAAQIAAKEAQNGGRETLRRAVVQDPRAFGWARVEGGGESCAFCLMLISRGPVYTSAQEAGLRPSSSATDIINDIKGDGTIDGVDALMDRWHENCDCRVVPVFDKDADWPGKDRYLEAEALWRRTTGGVTGWDKFLEFRRALGDGYREN